MNYIEKLNNDLKYYQDEYKKLENLYLDNKISFKEFTFETRATVSKIRNINKELIKLKEVM